MPLRLVRSDSNRTLWDTCVSRFLDETGAATGPTGYPAHLWIAHRAQRDALFEAAAARGVAGWLDPPFSFFSELPRLFDLGGARIGLLTRRRLVARLAGRHGVRHGLTLAGGGHGAIRGHMLDALFGELLPEGVTPDELTRALDALPGDDFTRARNGWIVDVYGDYLQAVGEGGRWDFRQVHALVAREVSGGRLSEVLRGAERLHVYGVHALRTRHRLFEALRDQDAVDVVAYLHREGEEGEWDELGVDTEVVASPARAGRGAGAGARRREEPEPDEPFRQPDLFESDAQGDLFHPPPAAPGSDPANGSRRHGPGAGDGGPDGGAVDGDGGDPFHVQPAPDAGRELAWVVRQVKKLLVEDGVAPWDVAVVARSGREDTARAYRLFQRAGVPATARIRTPLAQVPAMQALLELFGGGARGWTYRRLRNVVTSPYFDVRVDLRAVDHLAGLRRIETLAGWEEGLERIVAQLAEGTAGPGLRRTGLRAERVKEELERFRAFRETVEAAQRPRTEPAWVELTRAWLRDGVFGLRKRLCRAVGEDRWDVVRLDQRGLTQVEHLLAEWADLDLDADAEVAPGQWERLFRRLLEGNEIVLSTPLQKGVQILEAHDAALTPFRHVFVVHANDGEFPRAARTQPVLSDEELQALREAGLPVTTRKVALRRERALWRAVTANDEVTVTWRTTDAGGTPLLPSLMITDPRPEDELPRTSEPDEEPVDPSEAHRRAAHRLMGVRRGSERPEPIRVSEPTLLRRAVLSAYGETVRGVHAASPEAVPTRPNPWHGEVRDPVVRDHLAEHFGPERRWSASQLELYGRCPFLFLVRRVLWLEEVAEAERETTALTFGGVAHRLLEAFYERVRDELPTTLGDVGTALAFDEVAEAVRAAAEEEGDWLGAPVLWEHTWQDVVARCRAYVEWELEHMAETGERPHRLELAFGGEEGVPLEGADVAGRRQVLRLRGRIDRVDVRDGMGGPTYRVLDYKSGRLPSRKGYLDGSVLQTALYLRALEAVEGTDPASGRYRSIRKPGDPIDGRELEWGSEEFARALELAFTIPLRVRAGLFEPVMAGASKWEDWDPGPDVTRTRAVIPEGSRFDEDGDLDDARGGRSASPDAGDEGPTSPDRGSDPAADPEDSRA